MKSNENLKPFVDCARKIKIQALKKKYNIHKNLDNSLDAAIPGATEDEYDNHNDVDISGANKDNYVAHKQKQHPSLRTMKKQESIARIATLLIRIILTK